MAMIEYKTSANGFTLIEMVTVIIILGIVAVGASSLLQYGTKMYVDAKGRDQLISGARFVLERLKREIRHAAPNSLKVETISGNPCLSFYPIDAVTTYIDIPVLPESARNIVTVKGFDGYNEQFLNATHAVVYGLEASDYESGSGRMFRIQLSGGSNNLNTTADPWQLTLGQENTGAAILFETDSPTKRMYFISSQTSFCFVGDKLTRNGMIIADKLAIIPSTAQPSSTVDVSAPSLQRNGLVRFTLNFQNEFGDEAISLTTEIQVPNVP